MQTNEAMCLHSVTPLPAPVVARYAALALSHSPSLFLAASSPTIMTLARYQVPPAGSAFPSLKPCVL